MRDLKPRNVKIGDVVLWYVDCDPNQEPQAAMVSRVGQDSVDLSIFAPDTLGCHTRSGVRHVSHPDVQSPYTRDQGSWDWGPWQRDTEELRVGLDKLQVSLGVKK